jgi:hypothetical protein
MSAVYTVPASSVAPTVHLPRPYERIVGIETPVDGVVWASSAHMVSIAEDGSLISSVVRERALRLNAELYVRLAAFFDRFIRDGSQADYYNCQRFARWMIGNVEASKSLGYKQEAACFIEGGELTNRNLNLGEIGVYGTKQDGLAAPYHAVVGLGEETDECLQVFSAGGHIGIATYANVREFYARDKVVNAAYGLYVEPQ